MRSCVHKRINEFIQEGMTEEGGLLEEHKNEFFKDQLPGKEMFILTWQMVVNEKNQQNTSKSRCV